MDWTEEDDQLLAETVLIHIRENSTQINAFDEVSKKLNIPAAECLFRWNSVVKHHYKNAISLAKKQRNDNFYKKIGSIMYENRMLKNQVDNNTENQLANMLAECIKTMQEIKLICERSKIFRVESEGINEILELLKRKV